MPARPVVIVAAVVALLAGGVWLAGDRTAAPPASRPPSEVARSSPPAGSTAAAESRSEADIEAEKLTLPQATPDPSKALCRDTAESPPPAPRSRFVVESGYFRLPPWDDRELSAEEKARDPLRDPFWPAFARCMQDAGIGIGLFNPDEATQSDIDRLVEEVNRSGPAYLPTPKGLQFQSNPASEAFLKCETILYEPRSQVTPPPSGR